MTIKHTHRVLPIAACATLAAGAMALANPAQAVEFSLHGQVNRAVTAADNGEETDVGFVDNGDWNSRFTFEGSQEMDNGATVGFTWQVGLSTNDSYSWDINDYNNSYGAGSANDTWDDRIAAVWIKGKYGKFTFGKVDTASDGTSELNYSPTNYRSMSSVSADDIAGSITGLADNGTPLYTLGQVLNNFDGFSRQQGAVYTTPSFGGFTLSGGVYEGHAFDIVPRYEYSFGDGGKFGFAVDYADSQELGSDIAPNGKVLDRSGRFREYGGSVSLLLPSGLNFAAAYKRRKFSHNTTAVPFVVSSVNAAGVEVPTGVPDSEQTDHSDLYYGSIGYTTGKHAVSIDYTQNNDRLNEGSEGKSAGIGYAYLWTDSITLYASYHHYWLDNLYTPSDGQKHDAQGIDQVFAGVQLQFL
jgi:hypothetical protein